MQCLQHPYFQVGVRTPLTVRSPRSNASSLASKAPQQQPYQQQPPLQQQQNAQSLSQQRRLSHDAPLERKVGALPGVASGARGAGAAVRDVYGAGQLPSLHSFGSLGPRNARYKVGVQPAAVMAAAASDGGSAGQQGSAQAKLQASGGTLPALAKVPLGRGVAGAKAPGGLEARYGLGRRY